MSVSSEMESDLLSKVQTPVADYEKDLLTDGPIATGYENYVRNCFRSGAKLPSTLTAADQGVSATRMLKMQESFGPSALDDTCRIYLIVNLSSTNHYFLLINQSYFYHKILFLQQNNIDDKW